MYKLTKDDQSHIKQITKSIMNSQVQEIWATEKVEVTKIIINYSDIFSQSKDDVRLCELMKHRIVKGNQWTIAVPIFRASFHFENKVDN